LYWFNASGTRKPTSSIVELRATTAKVNTKLVLAAFQDLLDCKQKNGGTCKYGDYKETVNRYHDLGNKWLTRQHLTYRMEHYNLLEKQGVPTNVASPIN
jgi:hypothetical protein